MLEHIVKIFIFYIHILCMCICVCMYVCMYIYIYIYIYTHTHIHNINILNYNCILVPKTSPQRWPNYWPQHVGENINLKSYTKTQSVHLRENIKRGGVIMWANTSARLQEMAAAHSTKHTKSIQALSGQRRYPSDKARSSCHR